MKWRDFKKNGIKSWEEKHTNSCVIETFDHFCFAVQMDRSRVRASCLCHGDYTALVWKKNHKFGVK